MSNNVVPFQGGSVPAAIAQLSMDGDDLTSGVSGGFAVVSFRGSKWRIKYQGEEHPILNADGDPVSTLECVLVRANKHISKNYYDQSYEEGANSAPDCFSMDGLRPDPSVQSPVSSSCSSCPKNVFGSRITPAGKKAKACQDNRRVAIVPLGDLHNTSFGGPMLLRVPAASLADLKMFGEQLKSRGFPYNSVAVRLGFDLNASYPKLTFKAVRPLKDAEAQVVVEHLNGDIVDRVLAEDIEHKPASPAAPVQAKAVDVEFEEEIAPAPTKPAAKPAAVKPVAAKPAAVKPVAAKPAPAPAPAAQSEPSIDADIESILASLDV